MCSAAARMSDVACSVVRVMRVESFGGREQVAVLLLDGVDRRDLGLRARDGGRHFPKVVAQTVDVLGHAFAGDGLFQAADRIEQDLGVGVAVAARIFPQEPAPALGFHNGKLDGVVIRLADGRDRPAVRHGAPSADAGV